MRNLDAGDGLFFVMGVPKSGTTWMQMMLNSHPDIFCRAEDQFEFLLAHIPKLLGSYNDIIKDANVKTAQQEHTFEYDRNDMYTCLKFLIIKALLKGNSPEIAKKLMGTKDNGIIDKIEIFQGLFPQAKFIHVVRNPKDVAVSSWHHNLRVEEGFQTRSGGDLGLWATTVVKTWGEKIKKVSQAFEKQPERLLWVRYEDMQDDPIHTIHNTLEYLGISSNREVEDLIISKNSFGTLAKGRKAGEEDKNSFYRKGISGDWKNYLTPENWQQITQNINDIMVALQYD